MTVDRAILIGACIVAAAIIGSFRNPVSEAKAQWSSNGWLLATAGEGKTAWAVDQTSGEIYYCSNYKCNQQKKQ